MSRTPSAATRTWHWLFVVALSLWVAVILGWLSSLRINIIVCQHLDSSPCEVNAMTWLEQRYLGKPLLSTAISAPVIKHSRRLDGQLQLIIENDAPLLLLQTVQGKQIITMGGQRRNVTEAEQLLDLPRLKWAAGHDDLPVTELRQLLEQLAAKKIRLTQIDWTADNQITLTLSEWPTVVANRQTLSTLPELLPLLATSSAWQSQLASQSGSVLDTRFRLPVLRKQP